MVKTLTRKRAFFVVTVSFFVVPPLLTQVTSREYKTGCEKEQFVKYNVNSNHSGFYDYSQWKWTKITIKNVSTSKVWILQKVHYENSTEKEWKWGEPVNVSNPFSPYVIAGGLESGEIWDPNGNKEINETTTRTYDDNTYTVNYYDSPRETGFRWQNVYWEKQAGLMLGGHLWSGNNAAHLTAIDTNIKEKETVLERFLPWILVGAIFITISIWFTVLWWFKRSREKN